MIKDSLIKLLARFPGLFWVYFTPKLLADPWQKKIFPQHRWLLKIIKTLKPRSILEPGCGFGRNLSWLIKQGIAPSILTGVDPFFRPTGAFKYIKANVLRLPFIDNHFDLVFTHGLLMHIAPHQLPRAFTELIRVSQKYLIIIEEVRARAGVINYYTWAHDYEKIISQFKLKVLQSHLDRKLKLKWLLIKK